MVVEKKNEVLGEFILCSIDPGVVYHDKQEEYDDDRMQAKLLAAYDLKETMCASLAAPRFLLGFAFISLFLSAVSTTSLLYGAQRGKHLSLAFLSLACACTVLGIITFSSVFVRDFKIMECHTDDDGNSGYGDDDAPEPACSLKLRFGYAFYLMIVSAMITLSLTYLVRAHPKASSSAVAAAPA